MHKSKNVSEHDPSLYETGIQFIFMCSFYLITSSWNLLFIFFVNLLLQGGINCNIKNVVGML